MKIDRPPEIPPLVVPATPAGPGVAGTAVDTYSGAQQYPDGSGQTRQNRRPAHQRPPGPSKNLPLRPRRQPPRGNGFAAANGGEQAEEDPALQRLDPQDDTSGINAAAAATSQMRDSSSGQDADDDTFNQGEGQRNGQNIGAPAPETGLARSSRATAHSHITKRQRDETDSVDIAPATRQRHDKNTPVMTVAALTDALLAIATRPDTPATLKRSLQYDIVSAFIARRDPGSSTAGASMTLKDIRALLLERQALAPPVAAHPPLNEAEEQRRVLLPLVLLQAQHRRTPLQCNFAHSKITALDELAQRTSIRVRGGG